jgi:hypothetical protein
MSTIGDTLSASTLPSIGDQNNCTYCSIHLSKDVRVCIHLRPYGCYKGKNVMYRLGYPGQGIMLPSLLVRDIQAVVVKGKVGT